MTKLKIQTIGKVSEAVLGIRFESPTELNPQRQEDTT